MDRLQKAIANTRRRPSGITASLGRGLSSAGIPLSVQPLVRQYGQTPATVLQYCPPGATFVLEPESGSPRSVQTLCCGWWDAPNLRRTVPEQTQKIADKAAEATSWGRSQLVQEVRQCDFGWKEHVTSLSAHLPSVSQVKSLRGSVPRRVSVLQNAQLHTRFRKLQLDDWAAQQDLQVARLALIIPHRQGNVWRDRMHTAEHRAAALQQLVHQAQHTIQELQTAAVNQVSLVTG